MKTKVFTTQLFVLFLISTLVFPQKDNSVKEKIDAVKGNINKIIVSTSEGDVIFEGNEAEQVWKKMKAKGMKKIKIISDDGDILTEDIVGMDDENVMVWTTKDGEEKIIKHKGKGHKMMMFMDDDAKFIEDGKTIKVEVDDENGEKKVTVTTNEDGEEKVEVYEGKEADEYLEKMEKDGDMIIDIDVDTDSDDLIWISEDGDMTNIEKDVRVEIENGKKKVTVTTIEDGEKKVEVFEGDEADKFFESENGENITVKVKKLKDGKHKKVIIKELKKEEKE